MASTPKRKAFGDNLTWPDNIGQDWKNLFLSGKYYNPFKYKKSRRKLPSDIIF